MFCLIAATAGFGGGNFASSMANINFFYPAAKKGAALGLNAAGGNLGVALIQLLLPVIVGGAGIFGLVKASERRHPPRAGGVRVRRPGRRRDRWRRTSSWTTSAPPTSTPREQLQVRAASADLGDGVPLHRHVRLVHRLLRRDAAADQAELLGARARRRSAPASTSPTSPSSAPSSARSTRPLGGWLADRFGGARVTLGAFAAMVVFTLAVLWTLMQLTPNPAADPAIADGDNQSLVPVVPRLLPLRLRRDRHRQRLDVQDDPGDLADRGRAGHRRRARPSGRGARSPATKQSSAALGVIGAVGALGGFLIPIAFSSPWVDDPLTATKGAFLVFTGFYVGLRARHLARLPAPAGRGRGARAWRGAGI